MDEARRQLIVAQKELATEELPKLVNPATTLASLPEPNESDQAAPKRRNLNRGWKKAWLGQTQ